MAHKNTFSTVEAQANHPGYCEPKHLAWLSFSGDQTQPFLQGQLCCDVNQLSDGQVVLGAYSDPKGRVIATFFLLFWQQKYFMLLPRSNRQSLKQTLSRYAAFSKVIITECDPEWDTFCLSKPIVLNQDLQHCSAQMPWLPNSDHHWLLVPKQHRDRVKSLLLEQSYVQLHSDACSQWQIENLIPMIELQTSQKCLPQMLRLEKLGAVSFTKGCFVGQEVIARTQHLGKVKRHLYSLTIQSKSILQPGDPLMLDDHREAGLIITAVKISDEHTQILVVIPDHLMDAVMQTLALIQL